MGDCLSDFKVSLKSFLFLRGSEKVLGGDMDGFWLLKNEFKDREYNSGPSDATSSAQNQHQYG